MKIAQACDAVGHPSEAVFAFATERRTVAGSPEELWRSGWWWEGEEDLFAPAGDGEEAEGTAQHTRVHRALAAANVLHNLTLQVRAYSPQVPRALKSATGDSELHTASFSTVES